MTQFMRLNDLPDISGKTVLLRADVDVPLKDGHVTDDTRLKALIPTLQALKAKSCKIIIIGHLGRPKGQRQLEFSLAPVATHLSSLLEQDVTFYKDCIGETLLTEVQSSIAACDIALLENLRFYGEEQENDLSFAKKLSAFGEVYINNAFASTHRAHASVHAITQFLPSYAGLLIEKELSALTQALDNPIRPVAALIGGAKVSTKLSILKNLTKKVDTLIVGGGMANTFLLAQGYNIGQSLCEPDLKENVQEIFDTAQDHDCQIILPTDVAVAEALTPHIETQTVSIDHIPDTKMALDIGPDSIQNIKAVLKDCKTILWNGPLGAFEVPPFDKATIDVARYAAEHTQNGTLTTIAGGGDTAAALEHAGIAHHFSYISTAGGAFLEYIEGKTLPALQALSSSYKVA